MAHHRRTTSRRKGQAGAGAKARRRSRAPTREDDVQPLVFEPVDPRSEPPELDAPDPLAQRPAHYEQRRDAFLALIEAGWTHRHALRRTGLQWEWINRDRQHDAAFKARYEAAVAAGREWCQLQAEDEAYRRALHGRVVGVWHGGVQVGEERLPSDRLLERVLQSRPDGDRFAERVAVQSIDVPPPPKTMAEWEVLAAQQRARMEQRA